MREISTSYDVKKDDEIQMEYSIRSFWNESQIKSVLDNVNQDPKLAVIEWWIEDHTWKEIGISSLISDKLILKVRILENPFPVMVIVALIIATGALYYLSVSLEKIYLITESIPETAKEGLGIVALIGGIIVSVFALKKYL